MESRHRTKWILAGGLVIAAAAFATAAPGDDEATLARIRCATRLSIALTGVGADAALLGAADPQAQVDALLASPEFEERFARFVNASLNDDPGELPAEDASYWLARKVLADDLPWRDLFVGRYVVAPAMVAGEPGAVVRDDPDGLGYFRSPAWMRRYAGNEEDGYRLVSAYRIMQNTIGLELAAVDSAPDEDISATGRMAPACRGCHYDSPFALDKIAKILSRRVGEDETMTFDPPREGPQTLFDGVVIADDAELVAALVASTNFEVRTCRLAWTFLYGRGENGCEGPVFDRCVDAFAASGDVRDALRAVVSDPGYCQDGATP